MSDEIRRYMLSKRYESRNFGTQYEHMEPNPNGDYVRVDDHNRVVAELLAQLHKPNPDPLKRWHCECPNCVCPFDPPLKGEQS